MIDTIQWTLRWAILFAAIVSTIYILKNWKRVPAYHALLLTNATIGVHAAAMLLGWWWR